jgi:hypothetical protein
MISLPPAKNPAGDILRIADYNAMRAAIQALDQRIGNIYVPPRRLLAEPALPVRVFNDTGVDLEPYWVMGIKEQVFTADADDMRRRVLEVEVPTADQLGRFVILVDAIPGVAEKGIGWAWLCGVVQVPVTFRNETDIWADCKDGETDYLQSAGRGTARILWKESGTGLKWAVVQFPFKPAELLCKTEAAIALDASGNVIECNKAGTAVTNAVHFAATNIGPGDAESGDKVVVNWDGGGFGDPFFDARRPVG